MGSGTSGPSFNRQPRVQPFCPTCSHGNSWQVAAESKQVLVGFPIATICFQLGLRAFSHSLLEPVLSQMCANSLLHRPVCHSQDYMGAMGRHQFQHICAHSCTQKFRLSQHVSAVLNMLHRLNGTRVLRLRGDQLPDAETVSKCRYDLGYCPPLFKLRLTHSFVMG